MASETPDPFRDNDWRSEGSGNAGLYGELPALPTRAAFIEAQVREPETKTVEAD